uniref:Protein transport protein Sec24Clike [Apis florea] n=1 Tax=Lepeophtheirus salmonis TaxID=72036 RepID=A0A0K2V6C3_LEPSM
MSLGPPHPHQRPAVSPGLAGPMGSMNLGPPIPSSNGLTNGLHPPKVGTSQAGEVGSPLQNVLGPKGPGQGFSPSTPHFGTPMPFSSGGPSPRQPPPVSSPFPSSLSSPMQIGPPSMGSGKPLMPPPVGASTLIQAQGNGGRSTPGSMLPPPLPPSISTHGPSPTSIQTNKQSGAPLDANPSSSAAFDASMSNASLSGIASQSPMGGMYGIGRSTPMSSSGDMPPKSSTGGPPLMSSSGGFDSMSPHPMQPSAGITLTSTSSGPPPMPSSSGMPPASTTGGPPPMPSFNGMSTSGGPSNILSSNGIPPASSASGPPLMSSPDGMSLMSSKGSPMPGLGEKIQTSMTSELLPTPVTSAPVESFSGMSSMSVPGGASLKSSLTNHSSMGMPPMSRQGVSSSMGMPPISTQGASSSMGMPPMSTHGLSSPMGMPPMSTHGLSSPMGMPPMSTQAVSSPMGMMPAKSPLGGPSSIGARPTTTPGGFPPMPTSEAPAISTPGGFPPMSTPGGFPPMSSPGGPLMGMPPMSTPGGFPPTSTSSRTQIGVSPILNPGGSSIGMQPMPTPGASPMGMPPMSTPGAHPMGMTSISTPGAPPMGMTPMQTPCGPPMGMPSMQTPGAPPMGMPPMQTPGAPSMGMPPMQTPGAPPMGMPPMLTPGTSHMGMPPMLTPGASPMGMPPMSTPGAPPMSTPGGFPPRSGTLPPPPGPGMSNSHGGLRPGGYPNIQQPVSNAGGMQPPMMGAQPGYPSQSQFGGAPSSGKRGLDPDNMPSPIAVMEDDSKNNSGFFDTREKGLVPPLVTTKFVVRDCGNASPRYVRSTMYHIPATPDLMKQCGVPFGLVITPLALTNEGESEPAVTDFGPGGPVRCVRCKAYMCPFMQFVDGGRRFQCIFCKATSDVPQEYFQHLDHNGMRLDHYQRPELCMGTYEVMATKEYCRESVEPLTPGIIFAIDVSYPMIKEGIVNLVCQNMKELLKTLPTDIHCDKDKMKVGFMAYDNKINFYNIKGVLTQPQQMTVSDVNDMFVPLVDGFMVDIKDAESVINSLMEQIPVLFGETRETETMLGPVIQAGKEAFKAAKCSGKLVVFHHNLPICDAPGKLINRDDRKLLNTEKEKAVLSPQSRFYNELGQECVSVGCSVDLFLFNNAYIDVATLSQICRLTGGQLYKYTYFQSELDGERFLSDLRHNIKRSVVFDAIMRVRTSTGVRPVDFFGSFYMANSTDTELASINSDMSVACEIKHDDKLTDEDGVYIQIALLFTSCSGQRRLRIINLSLNTGTNLADMYRSCDLDTIINFTAKQSISRLMESNPKTVKELLINNCAQILACYRKNCASNSSVGQLILPECMKLLPLYTNCLIKSDALVGGQDVGCDERAFLMSIVCSMDVKSSVSFFYPSLIPIHDVDPTESHIPKIIRCSYEKIREDGVYLLENGLHIFMYIGLGTDSSWVKDIFGVESASQIDVEKVRFDQVRDNPRYKRVSGIIRDLRMRRSRYMRLFFVRPKDKLDILFKHFLCEDRTGHDGNFSYVDFLCFMHKEIRALLG